MPLTLAAMFAAMGTGVAAARLPSLLAGAGVIIVVYALALELAGPWAALIAATLCSVDNFLFLAARTTRPEAFVTFFSTLGLLLYLKNRRKYSAGLACGSAAALGLAMNYHVVAIPAAIAVWLFFLGEFKRTVWRQPRVWIATLTLLVAILPFAIWIGSSPAHSEAFRKLYGQGEAKSTLAKIQGENVRYSDFVGLGSQRFHLPYQIPYRLPVVCAIACSLVLLYRHSRNLLSAAFILLGSNLLGWIYLVNKTSRYFAIVAPIFAIVVAIAAASIWNRKGWGKPVASLLVLCMFSQLAGNLLLLYRSKNANYPAVNAQLRSVIPAGESVYGAITFWMALHDRRYLSFDRTPLEYAIGVRRPSFMITNDRVMISGSGYGQDNFADLRMSIDAFVEDHATLVGTLTDPFYGNLRIYRVRYKQSGQR
jgi:4-amino-4-deoxy-L-arabinose transferase-like glycosyltransferase